MPCTLSLSLSISLSLPSSLSSSPLLSLYVYCLLVCLLKLGCLKWPCGNPLSCSYADKHITRMCWPHQGTGFLFVLRSVCVSCRLAPFSLSLSIALYSSLSLSLSLSLSISIFFSITISLVRFALYIIFSCNHIKNQLLLKVFDFNTVCSVYLL